MVRRCTVTRPPGEPLNDSSRTRPHPCPHGSLLTASKRRTVGIRSASDAGASVRTPVLKSLPHSTSVLWTTHGLRPPWPLAPPVNGPVLLLWIVWAPGAPYAFVSDLHTRDACTSGDREA